jgi:hypothetical protein
MRRAKAALIHKATGNLRAVRILFDHTDIEKTSYYLGVEIDDAITLAAGRGSTGSSSLEAEGPPPTTLNV